MVHIPFLNIEVPEPRLATLVPDLVTLIIRLCTRTVDAAFHVTHPLPPEVEELFVGDVIASFPREVQRVFRRAREGKHRDEDQVSEELEDATLDYYRRMIRTAAVGETEEDQEDVTAYKLGLDRPSALDMVWDQHLRQHPSLLKEPEEWFAMEGTPEERASIASTLDASYQEVLEAAMLPGQLAERRRALSSKVRSSSGHTAGSALRAGLGLALGVGVVRGVGLLLRRLRALRKPKKGKKAAKASSAPHRQAAAAAATEAGAGAQRGGQAGKPQQQAEQKGTAAESARTRTRSSTARKR